MGEDLNTGVDLRYDLELTLEEAVAGLTTTLRYPRVILCGNCNGSGLVPPGFSLSRRTICTVCGGAGLTSHETEIKVRIPAGVDTGSRVRIAGHGNERRGGPPGDLYIVTHVAEHEIFERRGDDLYFETHASPAQLAAGNVIEVQTVADGPQKLKLPAGTKKGTMFRLRGLGVPSLRNPQQRGDLFVTVRRIEPASAARLAAAEAAEERADKSAPREDATPGLRVFLCHSSSDKPAVRALYRRLRADGLTPWLDEEDLLPGEKWGKEIPKAVRSCDVVLVCLSKGSVNKRGYLQKEIRYALDAADEQPEGTIFLIPLKLEECEIPEHLGGWQWVNFFEEKGYERLMRALRKRARSL